MKIFIRISIGLALLIMGGEIYRSWGDGRNIIWVLDDVLAGLYMMVAALMFRRDTPALRALFASSWGVAVGMLYMSFFSSLLAPEALNAGNLNKDFLITAKGICFALSFVGLAAAILLPFKKEQHHE